MSGPHSPSSQPRPARSDRLRSLAAAAARWTAEASYVRKWIVLGVVIGVIAGLGAVVFYEALKAATHLFLTTLAGYTVPTPFGEGNVAPGTGPARPWALPLIAAGGALLGAILVFRVAPEAEGHGTDAAIAAVHHNPRGVRFRTVLVKIVASALTIGSGGSGGREGPTGQISAGFGSLLARVLELSPEDARVAVSTGIGAGIGAIFGAPLGGAVLAAEIIYRDDLDPAALLPSFIASGVGYAVFGAVEGYGALFGAHGSTDFTAPANLPWFALIGILGGLVGLLYARGFYGLHDLFGRWGAPRWLKPALGGALVGAIGIVMPEVLGTGYGWIQHGLGPGLATMPLWIVVALPFARILATGLSIGSGGSGGIFGPGMVIGAFIGAAVWRLAEPVFPGIGADPAPFVIVGMMCCFGSVARAPLAVLLMVAEMSGSIAAIEPGMIAVGLAWLIVRRTEVTMYRSQLPDRDHAPGRRLLGDVPLLEGEPVESAMGEPRLLLGDHLSVGEARLALAGAGLDAAPVVDRDRRFEGTINAAALLAGDADEDVRPLVDAGAASVPLDSTIDVAVDALASGDSTFVTVLDDDRRVLGTVAIADLAGAYRRELRARADAGAAPAPA
ncbi:MAG TPA: chloride channel protein [Solirubrobacterales bacterium]|nr:chloride channel protein [Solirubrobacterales bacterium]